MINISFTYIIADNRRIETTDGQIFHVDPADQKQRSLNEGATSKERTYKLECGELKYDIICPEMHDNGAKCLYIAEFHIPRRPYPIYVYLYGIILYSSNPEMGQREAAEKTRKHFGLETFSHTTLGRAIIKLELRIKAFEGKSDGEELTPEHNSRCFPTVELTRKRKDAVISFLAGTTDRDTQSMKDLLQPKTTRSCKRPPYVGVFFDLCHKIVSHTYKKYRYLLL